MTFPEFPLQRPVGPVFPLKNVPDLSSMSVTKHKQSFDVFLAPDEPDCAAAQLIKIERSESALYSLD